MSAPAFPRDRYRAIDLSLSATWYLQSSACPQSYMGQGKYVYIRNENNRHLTAAAFSGGWAQGISLQSLWPGNSGQVWALEEINCLDDLNYHEFCFLA